MMYILLDAAHKAVKISREAPQAGWAKNFMDGWISSRDVLSFWQAARLAEEISSLTGQKFIPTDRGEYVSPRYDIVSAPRIGDEVSYGFNGDCYPDGTIVKISPSGQITTSTGGVYRKSRKNPNRACWTKTGGTWSLVMGHHFEQNAEF